MLFHAFLLALSALAPFTLAQTTAAQGQDCVQGVLVVAARGSDPNWHDATKTDPDYAQLGELRNIANGVVNEVKMGSRVRAVPYPATTDDYPTSVSHGVAAVKGIIRDYVDGCSKKVDPKIVLLGYSQGAQVMSDVLVGGGGGNALEAKYTKRIVAGALFADPSYVDGLAVDAGNSTKSGTQAKTNPQQIKTLNSYKKILRDYCQAGDAFCASGTGPNNIAIHLQEVETYKDEAVAFLRSVLK